MSKAGRVTTQPLRPYMRLPEQSAAPIAAASTTNACVLYTDGTSLLVSIDAAAYTALALLSGGTFTGRVIINNNGANDNNVLEINKNPAGTQDGGGVLVTVGANVSDQGFAIRCDWRATQGTTAGAGVIDVTVGAATTLPSGGLNPITGVEVDLSTNLTANNNAVTGARILIPATTRANTAGEAALVISTDATLARAIDCDVANTSGTLAILRYGAAVTLTATALIGLDINLATNVTAATNDPPITGIAIRIPATDAAAAAGEAALYITSDATAARSIDVDVANTSGTIAYIRYGAGTTLLGALTGINIDLTTNVSGVQAVACIYASTSPAGSSASYCATFDFRGTAGTAAGNAIVNVAVGGATTLTGQLVGIECDLSANVTPGANAVIGQRIIIPATTRANTAGEAALVINSDATRLNLIYCDAANTGGTLITIGYGAATTLSGATAGCTLNLWDNVSGGAQDISGWIVYMPPNVATSSFAGRFAWASAPGTAVGNGILNVDFVAATSLTGRIVGIECDLSTNNTPGANACIGQRILIPATTRANTALEGALVIASDATAARAIDIDIANTSGTPFIMRYGAATELNAVVMATLDMSTNVTTNTSANVGLDIIMLAADRMTSAPLRINGMRIFTNAGIPLDANGSNGDLYIDTAGDKDAFRPTIYQRQSAAWVSIA